MSISGFFKDPSRLFMAVSCASFLTSRAEKTLERSWSHIADFSKMGDVFLGCLSFYNIQAIARVPEQIRENWANEPSETVANSVKTVGCLARAFSSLTDLIDIGVRRGALDSSRWTPLTTAGHASSVVGSIQAIYENVRLGRAVHYSVNAGASLALHAFLLIGAVGAGRSGLLGKVAKHHMLGVDAAFTAMTATAIYRYAMGGR